MHPFKRFSLILLLASLAACSATPEYPGVKTNAVIGQPRKNYTNGVTSLDDEPMGLIHTKPAVGGDQAVCVGEWCSCETE